MKTQFTLLAIFLFIFTSCTTVTNTEENGPGQITTFEYHLTNVTGGIAGVNIQFDVETIIWFYNREKGTIKVTNNNTDNTLEDAFDTGTYSYQLIDDLENIYIIIEDGEYGKFTSPTENGGIIIDRNQTLSENLSDQYIYTFTLKTIITDAPN